MRDQSSREFAVCPCERQAVCSTRLRSRPSTNPRPSSFLSLSLHLSLFLPVYLSLSLYIYIFPSLYLSLSEFLIPLLFSLFYSHFTPFESSLSLSGTVRLAWEREYMGGRRSAEEYETIASLESQESLEPVGVWLAIRSVSFNCACSIHLSIFPSLSVFLSFSLSLSQSLHLSFSLHLSSRVVNDVVLSLTSLQRVSGEVYRLPTSYAFAAMPTKSSRAL